MVSGVEFEGLKYTNDHRRKQVRFSISVVSSALRESEMKLYFVISPTTNSGKGRHSCGEINLVTLIPVNFI